MKLLVVGAESAVGSALVKLLAVNAIEYKALATTDINLQQKMPVAKVVSQYAPTQVINVATYGNLEQAEVDTTAARTCDELNSLIPAVLAEVCAHLSLPLIQHSSSFVFDGQKLHPYTEEDQANPVCRYGVSKWSGERSIRDLWHKHLILRTDWVFSSMDSDYFQRYIDLCKVQNGRLEIMNNRFSPTPAADVARVLLAISQQLDCAAEVWGTYHYSAQQPVTQEIFVENFLQEAAQFDQELASAMKNWQVKRLPVKLPYIPSTVLNGQKLFETFGIRGRVRNSEVTALLKKLYGVQEVQEAQEKPPTLENAAAGERTGRPPRKVTNRKQAKGRPLSRKGATQKAK